MSPAKRTDIGQHQERGKIDNALDTVPDTPQYFMHEVKYSITSLNESTITPITAFTMQQISATARERSYTRCGTRNTSRVAGHLSSNK